MAVSPLSRLSAEIFVFAFALGFACYAIRAGYELVRPVLWLACPLSVLLLVGVGVWLYLRYQNTYWG